MKLLKIRKEDIRKFLSGIMSIGDFYAPVNPDGRGWRYECIERAEDVNLNPGKPVIPLKRFFHPPRLKTFSFDSNGFHPITLDKKILVFGVHPCDINGTLILDSLFLEGPYADPYYKERREKTYVIGLSCMPDDTCFCKSMNTHIVEEGFDVFFSDIGEWYIVWVATSKGDDLIHTCEELFTDHITAEDIDAYVQFHKKRDASFKLNFDMTAIADKMELNYEADFWRVLGEKCLSCGQCTMVCPSCNCYNVTDVLEVDENIKGERRRHWDSCMFEYYSKVASGENFRAQRAERIRLWYTHKLKGFNAQYGRYACVGCGRCIEYCPVDINVRTVWEYLHGLR